jgi:hypothetical protein
VPTRGGEAKVDETVDREAKKRGWWALKMTLLKVAGLPDWFVLAEGGKLVVIECKGENGRVSKVQKFVHERLERLGFQVWVPSSPDEVRDIFAAVDDDVENGR